MRNNREAELPQHKMTRRTILRAVLGATSLAATGALLGACGGGTTGTATSGPVSSSAPSVAPSTVPSAAPSTAAPAASGAPAATAARTATSGPAASAPIEGAIVSGVDGVPDAFPKLPKPYKSVSTAPGSGGAVSYFCILFNAPPAARDQNQFWQELEKRLGVRWEPTLAPSASYGEKVTSLVAGGDLPDLCWLNPTAANSAGLLKVIQQGAFTDLTPYLSGDGLKEFPNLARYPNFLWKNVSIGGKIYGVPKPVLRSSNIPFYRQDWADKLGLSAPKNADEIYNMLTAFSKNDPDGSGKPDTFGLGSASGNWNFPLFTGIFRLPNTWRKNADGTLTHQIETPEHTQLVEFMRKLYTGGAYHPDAASFTNSQTQQAWLGSKIGMHSEGYFNFWGDRTKTGTIVQPVEGAKVVPLVPPGFDGGAGVTQNLPGYYGFTGIPAKVGKDPNRVKQLLKIADYLASPLGSEEWVFGWYGIEGVHHTVNASGDRITTDKATAEMGGLVYAFLSEYRFYFPNGQGEAEKAQQTSKQILAIGVDNPTLGLDSPTNNSKGAELTQLGLDRITEVVTGRAPMSSLDTYVKDWRSRGGDQIRKEFEQALSGQA